MELSQSCCVFYYYNRLKNHSHNPLNHTYLFLWYLAISKNFWVVFFRLSTAPWHFGRYGEPNFWSIFCFSKNCLNSLLENSPPLSLCIICGLWCVVKQLFNALITVADFLSIIHFAHAYLEKWSTIVNKYLYGLVHNTLANCTKSIWHLFKGLELRMWWTIFPFLSFSELTCHIWHLNQKSLTSP